LGILDLESASKTSGRKFYYLLRDGALLELALVNWAVQKLASKGYGTLPALDFDSDVRQGLLPLLHLM
jgi:seryl-tRNA synthetase